MARIARLVCDFSHLALLAKKRSDNFFFFDLLQRYQASVSLHKSLMSLDMFETPSENELQLTYSLPKSRSVTIVLVFLPNTRQIAEARVMNSDEDIDIQELVGVHTASNDVPGLLRAILARLRADV